MQIDQCYPCCKLDIENSTHALWRCPLAMEVWMHSKFLNIMHKFDSLSIPNAVRFFMPYDHGNQLRHFVVLCWAEWEARNHFVFANQSRSVDRFLIEVYALI